MIRHDLLDRLAALKATAAEMLDHGIVAHELRTSSFGLTASGAYRVQGGKEVVTDGAEA